MNPQTRKLLVQRLIPAIIVIGPEFERFGELLLDHVLSTPLEHSGLNALGFPVSRVLDSASTDGKVVAEYSAESDYFTAGMDKARRDIAHALHHRPDAELIYLLAAQPDRPQVVDDFLLTMQFDPRMESRSLKIWGAVKIAEHLVDKVVFNDAAVEALAAYLPVLTEIWEESARDRMFTAPSPRHNPRPDVNQEIENRLAATSCVTLAGIGGCGKSDAAAAFGATHIDRYDLRIWLDRDDIGRIEDLYGLPLLRGRDKRNIASLMKTRRCLLVIDDPRTVLATADLADLCGPGTHVLQTVRELGHGVYRLPDLSRHEAKRILENGTPATCPDDIFETIWTTVGGHPLSLALMNGAVRTGAPWADIALDCIAVGGLLDKTQRLADRLLGRLRDVLFEELAVYEWAGQSDCDAAFLRHAIRPMGVRKLNDHALTAADREPVVRLHDVVYSSLSSLDWWTESRRDGLDAALAAYLESASQASDLSLWSAAGSLRKRLAALVDNGDPRPIFRVALLAVTSPEDGIPVGDPIASAAARARLGEPVPAVLGRLLIESLERLYLQEKEVGQAQAEAVAAGGLQLYDDLASLPGLTDRQAAEIIHHRGKALGWLHRYDEAREAFETVMAGRSPLDATRLQLLRIYKRFKRFAEAGRLGSEILSEAERTGGISPSVLLATIQDIPWQNPAARDELGSLNQDFIEETVTGFANAGYDQAYPTLAAVARFWSKEDPPRLDRVMRAIPKPSPDRLTDDESRANFGDIYMEVARAEDTDVAATQELALSFYEAQVRPRPFPLQRQAELLLDMGRSVEAEAMLRRRDDLETNCWVCRLMARARLGQNDPAGALIWIDRALDDDKCDSRFFEFRALRYCIRRGLDAPDALDDLHEALRLSPAGRERDRLCELVTQAEAE
jgi:tetratricopeptide (TPR) repeat protein